MTEPQWKIHTPEYDGHAPDDWDGGEVQFLSGSAGCWISAEPLWGDSCKYRYRAKPLQDATLVQSFDDLKTHCLALPQADRDALIEALQKPQRDWADDVAHAYWYQQEAGLTGVEGLAAHIRSMCRPKDFEISDAAIAEAWSLMLRANGPEQMHKIFREALK